MKVYTLNVYTFIILIMSRRKKPFRINKRPSGIYQVMFATNPGKWKSTGQRDKDAANAWAEQHRIDIVDTTQTLKQFAEGFFIPGRHDWILRQNRKNKTFAPDFLQVNQGRLDNYILPHFGSFLLSAIKPRMIDDWLITLEGIGKPLADATKNKILITFRHVLEEAKAQELLTSNPAKEVTPITERKKTREPFTLEEINVLFPVSDELNKKIWLTKIWELFFRIELYGGLRPGEVAALRWCDFYPEQNGFVVSSSIENRTFKIKGLKTEKKGLKVKPVIVKGYLLDELIKLKENVKPEEDDLIFRSINGKVISTDVSNKHFKASVERAGIDRRDRTQYSLRHTFDTELLKEIPLTTVQTLMGHTTYRKEYDHRNGIDLLKQIQNVQPIIERVFS